jgi:hypothetical protein
MPILEWTLSQHFSRELWTTVGSLVQYDRLPPDAVAGLANRIRTAVEVYPCEILFIHRDEDGETIAHRENEIQRAVSDANLSDTVSPIAVIPVKMTEAWLLIDEQAIRKAAGFSSGRMGLRLPARAEIERRADPKEILRDAIRTASGQSGRKLARLNLNEARAAISGLIEDLTVLRGLPSFRHFEDSVAVVAQELQE